MPSRSWNHTNSGGLKGTALPPNYREYILETFNVSEERLYNMYSTREINATFPLCHAGRYHICPWVIMLPLDTSGEKLLDSYDSEIQSRAAFFDASIEGRWGGDISGDRVTVDFDRCECGHQGPTVGREITRYSDLPGGDKITCGQYRRVRAGPGMNALSAPHFVQGALVEGDDVRYRSSDLGADFVTPAIDLGALVMPRSQLPPLLDIKLAEIIDFLVEVGARLHQDRNPYLQECLELIAATNPLPRRVVENLYREAPHFLNRGLLESIVGANFANLEALDGWVDRIDPYGNKGAIRAFPPRMVHMLAGNAPSGCISSIAQGALAKAVNIFKMPSSDPLTTVAVLRTMAEVDPAHPVVRSMSAVYWQGGDRSIERTLYRPQYIDRIVAWGGGDAINNVIGYLGPGIQLVSFDPSRRSR